MAWPLFPSACFENSCSELWQSDRKDAIGFTSGGSEANDVAIKSARYATKRRKIVALDNAYHGRTGLSGSAGADAVAIFFHSENPADFIKVPPEDLAAMERALRGEDVAGVMMESIPAAAGFVAPSPGYLPGVKALCEKYGSLYIADEVQSGFGRTGKLWAVGLWDMSRTFWSWRKE